MSFEEGGFQETSSQRQSSNYATHDHERNGSSDGYQSRQQYQNTGGQGAYHQRSQYQNSAGGQGSGNKWQGGGKPFFRRDEPEGPAEWYMPYVATGNKDAPPDIQEQMRQAALELEKLGYTMRCGGMDGMEDFIEKTVSRKEIHLPWKGFNDKDSKFTFTPNAAKELASKLQPGFEGLKPVIQTFLAKNVRMIMGKDLKSPAMFMIVWTEDGAETLQEKTVKTGNSGHAIAVACTVRIPVFNFGKPGAYDRLKRYLGQ